MIVCIVSYRVHLNTDLPNGHICIKGKTARKEANYQKRKSYVKNIGNAQNHIHAHMILVTRNGIWLVRNNTTKRFIGDELIEGFNLIPTTKRLNVKKMSQISLLWRVYGFWLFCIYFFMRSNSQNNVQSAV